MDQLFVNERLPSPSPPASIHDEDEANNDSTASTEHRPVQTGKHAQTSRSSDNADLTYAEYRARRKSQLSAAGMGGEQAQSAASHYGDISREISTYAGQYGRRPTLSSRSTGDADVAQNDISSQGSFTEGNRSGRDSATSNVDLYTSNDGDEVYRPHSTASATRLNETYRPIVPRRTSRSSRLLSYGASDQRDGVNDGSGPRLSSNASGRSVEHGPGSPEFVVPRWQPDAEVTFCPICKTQFSFFVRKHHCRKCGRVVCNACSPHRIVIPHQYIVQPPSEPAAASSGRPPVDTARTRSSTVVENLGGGERVRLCNPCVPDPNIAPPQTRSDGQPISGHGRSQSTVLFSPTRRGDLNIPSYRPQDDMRDSGIEAQAARDRYWAVTDPSGTRQLSSNSFGPRSDSLARPDSVEPRSRSSTVGSSRAISYSTTGTQRQDHYPGYGRSYHAPTMNTQANLSRPLPSTPQPHRNSTQRRRIREEDQCWICFRELPSRELPNFEELRSAHVMACLETATLRASGSPSRTTASSPAPPPPPPVAPEQTTPVIRPAPVTAPTAPPAVPSSSHPSRPRPAELSTPESRMLARERQHAAIVLGQSSSAGQSSASAMSRVIPYVASEKDGIDDAECMICMEEFEVGQQMGRLECFCRFHLDCIKGWFERKAGKCPVHGGDFF